MLYAFDVAFDADFYYSNQKKVRIISLYIQFRDGVPDEDRRRLYQHARLSMPDQDAVNALVHLGLRISRVRALIPSTKLNANLNHLGPNG